MAPNKKEEPAGTPSGKCSKFVSWKYFMKNCSKFVSWNVYGESGNVAGCFRIRENVFFKIALLQDQGRFEEKAKDTEYGKMDTHGDPLFVLNKIFEETLEKSLIEIVLPQRNVEEKTKATIMKLVLPRDEEKTNKGIEVQTKGSVWPKATEVQTDVGLVPNKFSKGTPIKFFMKGENSNGSINFNVKKLMRRPGKADLSKAAETRRKKNECIIFNKTQRNII